jgi:hypothetical protein
MSNQDLQVFCNQHKINIVDTNKRYATYTALRPQYFIKEDDYNSIHTELINSFEPLYTITIPLSELERIKEFEEQVFNNIKTHGAHHYQMFEFMMEQKHQEKRLRDKYPAVKKAYGHYSLMLKLAESGEL